MYLEDEVGNLAVRISNGFGKFDQQRSSETVV